MFDKLKKKSKELGNKVKETAEAAKPKLNDAMEKAHELGEKAKETTIEKVKETVKVIEPNLEKAKAVVVDKVTKIAADIAIEEAKGKFRELGKNAKKFPN